MICIVQSRTFSKLTHRVAGVSVSDAESCVLAMCSLVMHGHCVEHCHILFPISAAFSWMDERGQVQVWVCPNI